MIDAVIFVPGRNPGPHAQVIVETALAALAECARAMPEPAATRAPIGLPLTVAFSGLLGLPEQSPELDPVVQEYRRLWR